MPNKSPWWAVLLILAVLPIADSTRYLPFLYAAAKDSPHPFIYLRLASEIDPPGALIQLSQLAQTRHDHYWLEYAAKRGDAQAQYAFAQTPTNLAIHYLSKAAAQGYLPAQISLYQHWFAQQRPTKALPWLRVAALQHGPSAVLLASQLSRQGKGPQALVVLQQGAQLGDAQAKRYLQAQLSLLPEQPTDMVRSGVERSTCVQRLQFLATSLHTLIQAETFQGRFAQDPRLQSLAICINPVIWLQPHQLSCQSNWQGSGRLGCNLADVSRYLKDTDFSHVVVFANKGKANVHNGFMFLDRQDDYQVFVHELAHFAGFIDEYPLSPQLAKLTCETLRAPNLRVVRATNSPNDSSWERLSPGVEFSKARTCDNHPYQAYKPTMDVTFMEFYDFDNIPPIYLAAWRQSLATPAQLTPAFINFAQVHESRNELSQASFWRAKYRQYTQAD